MKHFYTIADYSKEELALLVKNALDLKNGRSIDKGRVENKTLAMLFFNPSLRTRVSFTVAMQKLGGLAIDISIGGIGSYTFESVDGAIMNGSGIEHVREAAGVLSRYVDVIAVRSSSLMTVQADSVEVANWQDIKKDIFLKAFMKHATVPVISMESNVYHPCQGLGDAVTLKEKFGDPKGKKYVLTWTYHPKALPMATPNSQILAACDLGMNVVICHPKGWGLDAEIMKLMEKRAKNSGGSLDIANTMKEGFKGADVICAKSWGALKFYDNWDKERKIRNKLKHWIVDMSKMRLTNNACFMHCLPARRNVVATDDVLDSKQSIVIDQAENRLWAQMAVLISLLTV